MQSKSRISKAKAKEILHDGTVHGKPLTAKQHKFMAAKAYGKRKKYLVGTGEYGMIDPSRVNRGPSLQLPTGTPTVPEDEDNGPGAMGNQALAGAVPSVMSSLISLMDKPVIPSSQPLVNPMTMQAMQSPYAFGGTIQDLSGEELDQVQQMAEQHGVPVEDVLEYINSKMYTQETQGMPETYETEEPDDVMGIPQDEAASAPEFAKGGWIKKAAASIKRRGTKGKCTPITKPGCTGRARALALTFKKIARKRKGKKELGGVIGYGWGSDGEGIRPERRVSRIAQYAGGTGEEGTTVVDPYFGTAAQAATDAGWFQQISPDSRGMTTYANKNRDIYNQVQIPGSGMTDQQTGDVALVGYGNNKFDLVIRDANGNPEHKIYSGVPYSTIQAYENTLKGQFAESNKRIQYNLDEAATKTGNQRQWYDANKKNKSMAVNPTKQTVGYAMGGIYASGGRIGPSRMPDADPFKRAWMTASTGTPTPKKAVGSNSKAGKKTTVTTGGGGAAQVVIKPTPTPVANTFTGNTIPVGTGIDYYGEGVQRGIVPIYKPPVGGAATTTSPGAIDNTPWFIKKLTENRGGNIDMTTPKVYPQDKDKPAKVIRKSTTSKPTSNEPDNTPWFVKKLQGWNDWQDNITGEPTVYSQRGDKYKDIISKYSGKSGDVYDEETNKVYKIKDGKVIGVMPKKFWDALQPKPPKVYKPQGNTFSPDRRALGGVMAYGGQMADAEVEGKEIVQAPGRKAQKIYGPKHEDGGVMIQAPEGTKVFSDRLKIDGVSMAKRKEARDKSIEKLTKKLNADPTNKILQSTAERMHEVITMEEQQDMKLQEMANQTYAPPQEGQPEDIPFEDVPQEGQDKFPGGTGWEGLGRSKYPYRTGNEPLGFDTETDFQYQRGLNWEPENAYQYPVSNYNPGFGDDFYTQGLNAPYPLEKPILSNRPVYTPGAPPSLDTPLSVPLGQHGPSDFDFRVRKPASVPIMGEGPKMALPGFDEQGNYLYRTGDAMADAAPVNAKNMEDLNKKKPGLDYKPGVGDYLGMAGNMAGPILGLMNTEAMRKATRPRINRYQGVGQREIDSWRNAQDYAYQDYAEDVRDIKTKYNTLGYQGRTGASSVNTLRGLGAALVGEETGAMLKARGLYGNRMTELLGREGTATWKQDEAQARGQTAVDEGTAADIDAYWNARGENLQGLAQGVAGVGAGFNRSRENAMTMKLMNQLSKYGIAIDEDWNIVDKATIQGTK